MTVSAPDGQLAGKVALVTGAARGMGRAHAVTLASRGTDVVAVDVCAEFDTTDYPGATTDDLAETVRLVQAHGRRILATQADVRDPDAVAAVVADGVERFGRLDVVIANAGIIRVSDTDHRAKAFRDVVEVNLIGAWNTVDAAIPAMVAGGRGGSVVLVSSTQGIRAAGTERAGIQGYAASKRALVALMQVWADQLAEHSIRVNVIHPSGVATDMILNETTMKLAAAGDPWLVSQRNALPIALLQPEQIAAAVAWLVSDDAAFITGTSWPLDAGFTLRS
ncbi:mycofactocin-coupled SDR family oxidoreductase [Mycolicibacterium hodleri]|uniref:mycofactocin-coupled SDR family oxidoreductase n=1 Tax=Mycolicibacterium hodleri TaxID=49897 RepID=UPI0021F27E34|nr:mycofactocin-coupled SDR family oxidoreductase [Mycolicibacterium hodleri]